MCTSITLKNSQNLKLLARTMDFSFELDPSMVIMPRNHSIKFINENSIDNHYAYMGLSKFINNDYVLSDGINEHGLSIAVLYFEGYASYSIDAIKEKINLAPYEINSYLLSKCKSTKDVKELFERINIVDIPLDFIGSTPPLHWVITDKSNDSIIIEPLELGIKVYNNDLGVMANSPDLNWHLTNVRNYIGINQQQNKPLLINGLTFKPFGQASGTIGIPGDFTPPARFIRALYNKLSVIKPNNEDELVVTANTVLNSVKIPKGTVVTARNTIDYTQYTSVMVPKSLNYYFTLYNNPTLTKIHLMNYDLDSSKPINIVLEDKPVFASLK